MNLGSRLFKSNFKPELKTQAFSDLKNIVSAFSNLIEIKKIILFGSFTTDSFNLDSDLDIMILVSDDTELKEFNKKIFNLKPTTSFSCDILTKKYSAYEKESHIGGVCFDIREDGIELHSNWNFK